MSDRPWLLVASDLGEDWLVLLEGNRPYELVLRVEERRRSLGAIYKGKVTGLARAVGAYFVDIGEARDAFLMDARAQETEAELRVGEEVMIQVSREPDSGKGPRATRNITLAGWCLVLAVRGPCGVSRRIEDPEERERLRLLTEELAPAGLGLIARTSAVGISREVLERERDELVAHWQVIETRARELRAPALVDQEQDPAIVFLRDHLALNPERIVLDGPERAERLERLSQTVGLPSVELFAGPLPAIEALQLERELQLALSPHVPLPSGGRLVIETTEALTAIDVNSGSDFSQRTLEQTALATNLEAASEVVRQIQLRDLAGMIIVDFIDMVQSEHRAAIDAVLTREIQRDRSKIRWLPLTEFCIAQITRQRRRPSLRSLLLQTCSSCHSGSQWRPEAQARQLLRSARTLLRYAPRGRVQLSAALPTLRAAEEIAAVHGPGCGLGERSQLVFVPGDREVRLIA